MCRWTGLLDVSRLAGNNGQWNGTSLGEFSDPRFQLTLPQRKRALLISGATGLGEENNRLRKSYAKNSDDVVDAVVTYACHHDFHDFCMLSPYGMRIMGACGKVKKSHMLNIVNKLSRVFLEEALDLSEGTSDGLVDTLSEHVAYIQRPLLRFAVNDIAPNQH